MKFVDPDGRFCKNFIRDMVRKAMSCTDLSTLAQQGKFPNEYLGFKFDSYEGVFHTTFDCWQSYGGYNDLYDMAFDLGTSMEAVKFEFSSGGSKYCLWGWKGDYLNLGAGCEIGLYRKAEGSLGELGHYLVDPKLAMEVNGTLKVNGNNAGTYDSNRLGKHWWPAIFNPSYQGINKDEIHVQYKLTMPSESLYVDFKRRWRDSPNISNWNDIDHSFEINF